MDQEARMRRLLAVWKRSGLSLRKFGELKGLTYTTLVYWRRKLHPQTSEKKGPAAQGSSSRWLPVRVVPSPIPGADGQATYEVRLANGVRVGVNTGFDAEELTRLVQALSSC